MTDTLDRAGSVTKRDYVPTAEPGGVWYFSMIDPGAARSTLGLPPHGDPARDPILTSTLDLEDTWAAAINKAVTKIAVRGYEVSDADDSSRRTEAGQALVRDLDGPAKYRSGMAKIVQDFLLTDNGWFCEVVRASKSPGSKVKALYPLDSFRCVRTGNLDYPVAYFDFDGAWHKLRADQVIFGADMPSARSRMFGKGRCAASRAFQTIATLAGMKTYLREKITGSRALALHFIAGVGPSQIKDAMETSDAENTRKGRYVYKGAVMVPIMAQGDISVATVDLASLPDGFDPEQVERSSLRTYALAIGINPDELIDRAAGLNSGASAQVAENAAEEAGGLPYFIKDWEDQVNHLVMPKPTIYQIKTNDIRDQQAKAQLNKANADTIVTLLGSGQAPGVITPQMALQMAVDEGLVPREFLPADVTPEGVLTDSGDQSKPVGQVAVAPYAGAPNPAAVQPGAPVAAKARRGTPAPYPLDDSDDWEEAVKWAEEAQKE